MTTPITLYLKLTNGCPLSCSHCYLPESARKDHRVLGVDAMEEGILNLLKGNNRNRPVNVILHGGEPLLPGYINLKERIETIEALLGDRLIGWSIQSSLVGLTRQIIELLAEHQFHVGTSYDNFRFQRHPNLLEHWGIQVALLRGAGFVPGVSWTPGRGDDPHVVAEALMSHGFFAVKIDRCIGPDCPSNAEHTQLLQQMYQVQRRTGFVFGVIEAAKAVLNGNSADRWGTRCRRDFHVLGLDGEHHFCPDRSIHWQDNLFQDRREAVLRVTQCRECEWQPVCAGGCPITPLDDGSGECAGYRGFLDYLKAREGHSGKAVA